MRIIEFILDIFKLFYISIYKRLKHSGAKSKNLSMFAYFIILNFIYNIYLLEFVIKPLFKGYNISNWLDYNLLILFVIAFVIMFINLKKKIDYQFLFKYKRIINYPLFEFIVFLVLFLLIIGLNFTNK